MRKVVSDSFTELSTLRQNKSDFENIPFLMGATHDDLFVQRDAMQRWCSATKVLLQVARRIGASASLRRGMAENEGRDVEMETNHVIEEAPDLTDAAMRKRDMFDVVRYAVCQFFVCALRADFFFPVTSNPHVPPGVSIDGHASKCKCKRRVFPEKSSAAFHANASSRSSICRTPCCYCNFRNPKMILFKRFPLPWPLRAHAAALFAASLRIAGDTLVASETNRSRRGAKTAGN
jgi:hypothetical protein